MNWWFEVNPRGASDDELLLAVLNTTPTVEGVETDAWATDAAARDWLAARREGGAAQVDLAHLRATRTALQRAARGSGRAGGVAATRADAGGSAAGAGGSAAGTSGDGSAAGAGGGASAARTSGDGSAADFEALLEGTTLAPQPGRDGVSWALQAASGRDLAVRALLAYDTLERSTPGRLRPCQNHECSLFLIDRSKNNSARWCSMASCGNRLKARRHHERERASQG